MRKRRTREHIIADLGFNHVERQVLYAGYVVQPFNNRSDYGYDGTIVTFNEQGEIQSTLINFQLKSTDSLQLSSDKKQAVLDLSMKDLTLWLNDLAPSLIILYDAQKEIAYYLDLKIYFKENKIDSSKTRKFVRTKIPRDNIFNAQGVIGLYHLKKSDANGKI